MKTLYMPKCLISYLIYYLATLLSTHIACVYKLIVSKWTQPTVYTVVDEKENILKKILKEICYTYIIIAKVFYIEEKLWMGSVLVGKACQ